MHGGNGYTPIRMYLIPLNCKLKIDKMVNFVIYILSQLKTF